MDLLPSLEMRVNAAWLAAAMLAADLHACLQPLSLDGELAKATPKTLHYRVSTYLAPRARPGKRRFKLPAIWPCATAIIRAVERILALPHPT
ncbi:hypothetical protein ACIO53_37165 [Streptomyces sp. NPDC087305]|uniref:hypothetical protein n=1 Tax=Streptomyces sp. NPDC087305 TaxID=3365781 RepID=UPI0037FF9BE0